MLFGDNLLDFADPKQPTAQSRDELIQKHKDDFGKNTLFSQILCMVAGNQQFITTIIK